MDNQEREPHGDAKRTGKVVEEREQADECGLIDEWPEGDSPAMIANTITSA